MDRLRQFSSLFLFLGIFAIILLLHWPLLRLPFFWDEAGFYIPAAHDLLHFHSLIPRTTMDTGHPPLPAAYLALWFAVAGMKPAVARIAQLLVAAFALTNVFLLARRAANFPVAAASTIATAAYSIFFVQSSLAHADLAAAAFTLWGLRLRFEDRRGLSQLAFCLAVLSKETAVITPLALALWEAWQRSPERLRRTAMSLVPVLPLLAWFAYHRFATGRFFGSAEFYQYNVVAALTPLRFLLALGLRSWHLLGTMNMAALTAAMLVAMRFPPVADRSGPRGRIAVAVQLQFLLVMLAYVLTFSLLGGALLTRYLLPAYPLLIIIAMSTLRRRILSWEWPAAILVIFFILAIFFDPPYRFAPEDNLTYRDFVELHAHAANFLEQHEMGLTILTAWPANDELTKPYLGYVKNSMATITVPNFTPEEVLRAKQQRNRFQVAYLFSTKYEAATWFRSAGWEKLNRRFFDYHKDLSPEAAAELLGGKVVYVERNKAEWVEIIEMQQPASEAKR